MRTDNQRRSTNVEDRRGRGGGAGGGGMSGGLPIRTRGMSMRGIIIVGVILLGVYLFAPASIKNMVFGQLLGTGGQSAMDSGGAPTGCTTGDQACDFASAILGSTEDVWAAQFANGAVPTYNAAPGAYQQPVLVLFEGQVSTGCGTAPSSVGPFYCPADQRLYIDPSFYQVMEQRLRAPGDFAQAYVIAHEVGHHVQNLIGATSHRVAGTDNENSVRVELQADCLAGVWGHTAQANLAIDDADLREALNAAHAIGDDTLQRQSQGYVNPNQFSHGTSEQRMRWFRAGFDSGDARNCDTFALPYNRL